MTPILKLGSVVRDTVSGYDGVVTAVTEYWNGNIKYCVEARACEGGKPIPEQWFDAHRLRVVLPDEQKVGFQ